MADQTHQEREHFFGAAKMIAGLTLLSRVLGMVRGMGIAWLGASRATDAFQMAFAIPNLFRRLFGEGALSGAFVPVFTETAERSGLEAAKRLFANALGLLALLLVALLGLILLGLLAWHLGRPGPWDRRLLVSLLAVMLPYMVLVCLLALGSAALNCRGSFAYPAFAPIVLNVFIITAVWGIAPRLAWPLPGQLHVIAVSVPLAGLVQLGAALWLLRRLGFSVRPRLRPVEPGVAPMARMMAPMLLGLGFLQLTSLFDYVAGWVLTATENAPTIGLFGHQVPRPLSAGVLVRLSAANTLYQFPMGVLAISLGVAVFPLLSRYAARQDMANFQDSLNRALRLAIMEGLATGVGLAILAEPIVQLIFQHHHFTAQDTRQTAFILRMYCAGMWAFCSYPILMRAFYSLKQPTTPLKISCGLAVVYMVLVLTLVWVPGMGPGAFSTSAAVTFTLNACTLTLVLRRRVGRLGARKLAASVARSAACCAAMAGAIALLRWWLAAAAAWKVVLLCVPTGAVTFLLAAWLLRAPELAELRGSLRRKPPMPDKPPGV